MMRQAHRLLTVAAAGAMIAAVLLFGWAALRGGPQDLPWTPLDLGEPVGMFTGRKLAALADEPARCRALLTGAGVRFTRLPPLRRGESCGYEDAVRFDLGGSRRAAYRPATLGLSCPVAAALALWEWEVVQPAALRRLGSPVAAIDHFGSYNCRRLYGRASGGWSEHARANAVDIAGFRLFDGRRITIARNWQSRDGDGAFLHAIRDGACRLFATTLSPDYNAAHRDHLHLDQAARGIAGWRACR